MMHQEAAFEMDTFLTGMEAAVSTMLTIHDHFCTGNALSKELADELDSALFTVTMYMQALVIGERSKVDETFAALQAEIEAKKKAEHQIKVAAKALKEAKEEKTA